MIFLQINDVVLSCPARFTDAERRALLDSAKMSGMYPKMILA
jgi:molecular chaperone DnaK (HSP70)